MSNTPTIKEPGIYFDVPEDAYHADPCEEGPSLSSSVAKLMARRSPLHAWYAHPRLNKALLLTPEESTPAKEFGSVVHTLLLGQGRKWKEIVADDFRSKAAQAARDEARAAGLIPMLSHRLEAANTLATAARDQIAGTWLAPLFEKGRSEVTMVWHDLDGVLCRSRVDWLPEASMAGGHVTLLDIKTTGESAAPAEWPRHAFDMGYDIQAELYRRGAKELIKGTLTVDFVFVVIESEPPYCMNVFKMGGQALAEAEAELDSAIGLWELCLRHGKWPAYMIGNEPEHIDPPKWRSERTEWRRMGLQRMSERFFAPHNPAPGPA